MPIDLKSSKPLMYSTVLEVVLFSSVIKTDKINFDINDSGQDEPVILSNSEIENFIVKADSIINATLTSIYEAPEGLLTDSWLAPPRSNIFNTSRSNKLLGVKLNKTDAYTSYYTIKFTSQTEFKVISSLEGLQGTGNINNDFTTSNGVITIGTNSWDPDINVKENDEFYFSVIRCYPLIHSISTMLSASMILSEKYTEQIPNENEYPIKLWSKAMSLLSKLADPDNSMSLTPENEVSPETIPIDYHINLIGEDVSSYLTENNLDP